MSDDRYLRGTGSQNDAYDGHGGERDFTRDYGSGSYSSAREYEAAGEIGRQGQDRGGGGRNRDWSQAGSRARDDGGSANGNRDAGYGGHGDREQSRYNRQTGRDAATGGSRGGNDWYGGSYGSDARRFEDVGQNRHRDDDAYGRRGDGSQAQGRRFEGQGSYRDEPRGNDRGPGYGRQPQGYDYEERGFFQRAGDEVRSWFGDEEAERRREFDNRQDERFDNRGEPHHGDHDYHSWRRSQIDALDRDYHEYRQENRTKFANEFGAWRTQRQGQRDLLTKAQEHQEVVGSDGAHVGTIDHVRGDRLLLAKNDVDAGGRHHSIPSSWITAVDDKVTISKTAAEAKQQWRDEERNGAMFGEAKLNTAKADEDSADGGAGAQNLNKSFPGTY